MTRLLSEQEYLPAREFSRMSHDHPGHEERVRALIEKYERLGLRQDRQECFTHAHATNAQVLAMVRAGKTTAEIAAHFGKTVRWVHHAKARAQAREYRQEAA